MRFQKYTFSLSSKTQLLIRVHTTVLMRFRLFALKRSKTIEMHVVTKLNSMRMLRTHAPTIFLVIVFIVVPFRPFTLIRYACLSSDWPASGIKEPT